MQDYYSLYTWAMERQAQFEREAAQRRMVRHAKNPHPFASLRRRLPLAGRREDRKAA